MKFSTTYLILLVLGLSACGIVGEDAVMVPSYVYVPSYTYVTDSNTQGAPSQAFNDMWISNSGAMLGGIGLPSLIPVQAVGPTEMRVDAGISVTGQNDQRTPYPLMATHIEVHNLRAGVVDTIRPVFRYLPNADFKFIEDYDRLTRSFKINPSYRLPGDSIMLINDNRAWKPGSYSGKIEIDPSHQMLQLLSEEKELNGRGAPVYLEIDFKTNIPMNVGYYYNDPITGTSTANDVIQLFPTSVWKKVYIELTDEIASRNTGTTYIIYLAWVNESNVVPDIYIDNVKLIGLKG